MWNMYDWGSFLNPILTPTLLIKNPQTAYTSSWSAILRYASRFTDLVWVTVLGLGHFPPGVTYGWLPPVVKYGYGSLRTPMWTYHQIVTDNSWIHNSFLGSRCILGFKTDVWIDHGFEDSRCISGLTEDFWTRNGFLDSQRISGFTMDVLHTTSFWTF